MAISSRELLLIIRAQNQASGALRRVAGDVRAMGKLGSMQARRNQLLINERNLQRQLARIGAEQASIQTGTRGLRLATQKNRILQRGVQTTRQLQTAMQSLAVAEATSARNARAFGERSIQARRAAVSVRRLKDQIDGYTQRLQRLAPALQVVNARHSELASRLRILGQEASVTRMRLAQNAIAMAAFSQAMNIERWERAGRAMRMMGHSGRVIQMAGLAAGAGLAYAAHFAADFETKAQLVGTQMGKVGISFKESTKLGNQFADVALKILPQSTSNMEELTDAGYDLFSSLDTAKKGFLTVADGTKLLKLSSDEAIAGQTDIATAADATITIMSNYGDSVDEVKDKVNTMFSAVRFGRMTFEEFAKTMSTTVPAAKQTGQTFDTLAGTMALLTRKIPSVDRAAIGFARLMEFLTREKFTEGLEKAGITLTDKNGFWIQLPEMIDRIVAKFPQLRRSGTKELAQFFKTVSKNEGFIQARRAWQALVTAVPEYGSVLKRVTENNTEFEKALRALSDTTGVRWQKTINRLKALALELGRAMIPAIEGIIEPIGRLVDWFQNLDEATRKQIGRWAIYGAALALVGGSIMAVVGALGGFIALLGSRGLLFPLLIAGAFAASSILRVLQGNFSAVGEAASRAADLITSSWQNVLITAGLVTFAVLKLSSALRAFGTASAAAAVGMRTGGLIGSIAWLIGGTKAFGKNIKAAGTATSLAGRLAQYAGASFALLPGPVKLAGVAFGIAAAGLAIWKLRADATRRAAEELRAKIGELYGEFARAGTEAILARGLTEGFTNLKEARANLTLVKLDIKSLRQEMAKAKGDEKTALGAQLNLALVRRATILKQIEDATKAVHVSTVKYSNAQGLLRRNQQTVVLMEQQIVKWAKERERVDKRRRKLAAGEGRAAGDPLVIKRLTEAYGTLGRKIASHKALVQSLRGVNAISYRELRITLGQTIRQMERLGDITGKLDSKQVDRIFKTFQKLGRPGSRQELKLVAQVVLDQKKIKDLPKDIRRKYKIVLDAEIKAKTKPADTQKAARDASNAFVKVGKGIQAQIKIINAKLTGTQAREDIAQAFKKAIEAPVEAVGPSADELAQLGADISAGIAAGIGDIKQSVFLDFHQTVVRNFVKTGEGGSPMMLYARLVGKPIMQGIEVGMQEELPKLLDFARYSMEVLAGTFIQAREEEIDNRIQLGKDLVNKEKDIHKKKQQIIRQEQKIERQLAKKHDVDEERATLRKYKSELDLMQRQGKALRKQIGDIKDITAGDLAEDMKRTFSQLQAFDKSLTKIEKRGAPLALVDQLREMGIEGLKYIAMLANASPKEFDKFLRYWKKSMKIIKDDAQEAFQAAVKEAKKANWERIGEELADRIEAGAQKLLDTFNNFRSTLQSNWGQLFSGPTGLADKLTDDLEQAGQEFNDKMNELTEQLGGLQVELAELGKQAFETAADAFGPLFSGDWLSGDEVAFKKEWGIAVGMQDLMNDLQSQLDKFNSWRSNLQALAARIPPEMLSELEKLGPEAADNIAILAGATDAELQAYIGLWKQSQGAIAGYGSELMKTNQDLANQQMDILQQIADTQQQIADLMANPPSASPLTGADIIADAQAQAAEFKEFSGILEELRKRNVPGALILQLAEMGPDALPYLRGLQSMTDTELKRWVNIWTTNQNTITNATRDLMDDQINMWRSHGNNIANAIIAGVMDEQHTLLKFFKNMFISLLQGKAPTVGGGSSGGAGSVGGGTGAPVIIGPGGEVGTSSGIPPVWDRPDVIRAFQHGGVVRKPTVALLGEGGPEAVVPLRPTANARVKMGNQQPVVMNIHALHSEDLETTLQRASFRINSRRR